MTREKEIYKVTMIGSVGNMLGKHATGHMPTGTGNDTLMSDV